jgi:hypothetical protein
MLKDYGLDRKTLLSTVWLFVLLNFIYCDILGMHEAGYLKDILAGHAGGIEFTPGFLLGASVLMEIPIAMVLLSRVLKYKVNRWANIAAGAVMAIVQISSLFLGTAPTPSYIFFSVIEIAGLLFIVWSAWKWTNSEA